MLITSHRGYLNLVLSGKASETDLSKKDSFICLTVGYCVTALHELSQSELMSVYSRKVLEDLTQNHCDNSYMYLYMKSIVSAIEVYLDIDQYRSDIAGAQTLGVQLAQGIIHLHSEGVLDAEMYALTEHAYLALQRRLDLHREVVRLGKDTVIAKIKDFNIDKAKHLMQNP